MTRDALPGCLVRRSSSIASSTRRTKLADDRDARLIVLGSHGRNGVADLLLGSVAGAVAAHSRRSVLITHRRA